MLSDKINNLRTTLALAGLGRQVIGDLAGYVRSDEIPFDTDRKRMSVLCQTPQGRMLYCKGALETVLAAQFLDEAAAAVADLPAAAPGPAPAGSARPRRARSSASSSDGPRSARTMPRPIRATSR